MGRRSSPGAGVLVLGAAGAVVFALFGGCSESPREVRPPTSAETTSDTPKVQQPAEPASPTDAAFPFADVAAAKEAVVNLPAKGRAPLTDYNREAFGVPWSDTNDNGCDTRNDILRRDLMDTRVADCMVMSGVLRDPYSGDRISFVRGPVTSLDVQIDHVVPLANAWQTGASYWTPAKRERFANDRRNLLAVRGDLNLQKSDGDAATWLPPRKAFRCEYVAIQVLTKQRYGLWVTPAEKVAMQRILDRC
ncbi:MAG: HNH endonuclease [Actinobacteria bacterium]|nr:HNH endonuclease [Actinomycetota bacterium]MCB8997254.1 HNH endonuclease [Actinomycetota bacterium]MCB9414606.1 HNH endonuclease [Actinomycetota bacterium]MCB9423566.1 HNH endonuclease [Actinomycetota bacterium]